MSERYGRIFRKWVQDTFTPCAAVLASPGAEEACQRSGLSFEELLRPFSNIRQQLKLRTVATVSMLQSFTLRFVPAADCHPRSVEHNEELLAVEAARAVLPPVPAVGTFDRNADVEYETEWMVAAKTQVFEGQRFGPSEMLDQPTCFLYVVSSGEPNPLRRLEQMIQSGQMAPAFEKQFNCNIPRFYLLLHDAAVPEVPQVSALLE